MTACTSGNPKLDARGMRCDQRHKDTSMVVVMIELMKTVVTRNCSNQEETNNKMSNTNNL